MKSKKSKTGSDPKAKVKIKSIKLTKETIENLSDQEAGLVKGGAITLKCPKDNSAGSTVTIMQCWVARAVYGEENPRWMLFREWLMADAPAWFRDLYTRHGERFAFWLTPHAGLKSVIRLWMDSRINRRAIRL